MSIPCLRRAAPHWFPRSASGWRRDSAKPSSPAERSSPRSRGAWRRGRGSSSQVHEEAVAGQAAQRASEGGGRQRLAGGVAPAFGFANERRELNERLIAPVDEDAGVKEDLVRSGREDREAHVPLREMGSSQVSRQLGGRPAAIAVCRRQRL